MKQATKKVWYVYKKIFTDPMLDHKAPTQEWVQDCVDKADASKRAKELTKSTKYQHSFTYRIDYE